MDPSFSLEDIFQKNAKIFRSAFNYISQAGNQLLQSATAASSTDAKSSHPLVGQTLTIGHHSYAVRSLLAEGGYALVFAVEVLKDRSQPNGRGAVGGQWFALKRQLAADREAADAIVREINFLKQLSGHPSIVRFRHATKHRGGAAADGRPSSAAAASVSPSASHFCEFFVLTELCSGGPLIDVLRQGPLNVAQVCKILYATAQAINHMHDRNPPITHRDIKIENLLLDAHGHIKLCDFGSATTDIYRPCDEWGALVRSQLEEEIAKFTTPMYRAPEVLDTYQNFPIGPAQDIWALGCVLFYLCYRVHPFEDSAKLRILNAKYALPTHSADEYKVFHELIRQMLQPDPYSRPSIQDLCEQIEQLAFQLNVPLGEPVIKPTLPTTVPSSNSSSNNNNNNNGSRGGDEGPTTTAQQKPPPQRQQQQKHQRHDHHNHQYTQRRRQQQRHKQGIAEDDGLNDDHFAALRPSMALPNDRSSSGPAGDVSAAERVLINFDLSAEETSLPTATTYPSSTTKRRTATTASSEASAFGEGATDDGMGLLFDFGFPPTNTETTTATSTTEEATSSSSTASASAAAEHMCAAFEALGADFLLNMKLPSETTMTATSSSSTTTTPMAAMAPADGPTAGNALDSKQQIQKGGSSNNLEDILSSVYGFTSSTKTSNRSLADMAKESDALLMDPLSVRIRDWTSGKERNIRALLGSLKAILWEEAAHQWKQPTMAELFAADNVKRHYRRACLVVHPDKLVGSVHEPLAKAIFTELNDAWTEYQKNSTA